ncbi:hypothetical protein Hanom_Chr15g01341961 [Helianthus anomalus]
MEGLWPFYVLRLPHLLVDAPSLVDGIKFELHTLLVDAKAVADGDTVTVYVSTSDARESSRAPQEVQMAAVELERIEALTERNYTKADSLQKRITDVELLGFL